MPYLNWKERSIAQSMEHPKGENSGRAQMLFRFTEEELALLVAQLEEIYFNGGNELRMDLPEGWIVFWKSRESGSRLLLAHPQLSEWVATIALEVDLGKKVIEKLKSLASLDETLAVHELSESLGVELFGPGMASNVELRVACKK